MGTKLQNPPYVIGMPTETVYGLAARIDLPQGIEAIFKIKKRPFFDPLIVHVSSIQQAQGLTTEWSRAVDILARQFWPGPLTLVLPKAPHVSDLITSGLSSVGIRMPRHPLALSLIEAEGVPLAAPSANKFGKTSPTKASHVLAEFEDQIEVVDGGPCEVGLESTVLLVKMAPAAETKVLLSVLRPGAVLPVQIEEALSRAQMQVEWFQSEDKRESPGHMKHHYMPRIPLIFVTNRSLGIEDILSRVQDRMKDLPNEIEGVKIQKTEAVLGAPRELILAEDPALAARELYAKLRELGDSGADVIIFYKKSYHQGSAWAAVIDRLTKASSLVL